MKQQRAVSRSRQSSRQSRREKPGRIGKGFTPRLNAAIVRLAIWGLMPIRMAQRLLRKLAGGRP